MSLRSKNRFTKNDIIKGLNRLGELAVAKGIQIDLQVFGGAAIMLGFGARESTEDVDVVIQSPKMRMTVLKLIDDVAKEFRWPEDWLNDQVETVRRLELVLQTILRIFNGTSRNKNTPINPSKVLAEMARAALRDQTMDARAASLALHRWAAHHLLSDVGQPRGDHRTLVVCAALIELFAERLNQPPPAWSSNIGGLDQPFFFFPDARKDVAFGDALKQETPEPLKRRNLYSTSSYLQHI